MSQEERVILVDEENNEIGTALKSEVHTGNTPRHRAFSVFLFTKQGELLLQQRAKSKKTWPGVWSNSCCGHPAPTEETEAAAHRRIQQELGLKNIELYNMLPDYRYRAEMDGVVENEICPVFVGVTRKEINPNPDEIENVLWMPWPDFLKQIESGEAPYSPWAIEEAILLNKSEQFNQFLRNQTDSGA